MSSRYALAPKNAPAATTVLHFTDHGQDFLRWEIDQRGIVRSCEPFQASMWNGCVVMNPGSLRKGKTLEYISVHDLKRYSIKYPLAKIERRSRK